MTDESSIDRKFATKKFVSKLVVAGMGLDFIYRVTLWTGIQQKIKAIVTK